MPTNTVLVKIPYHASGDLPTLSHSRLGIVVSAWFEWQMHQIWTSGLVLRCRCRIYVNKQWNSWPEETYFSQVLAQNTQQAYSSWVYLKLMWIRRPQAYRLTFSREILFSQQERGRNVYLLVNSSCREDPRAYHRFIFLPMTAIIASRARLDGPWIILMHTCSNLRKKWKTSKLLTCFENETPITQSVSFYGVY